MYWAMLLIMILRVSYPLLTRSQQSQTTLLQEYILSLSLSFSLSLHIIPRMNVNTYYLSLARPLFSQIIVTLWLLSQFQVLAFFKEWNIFSINTIVTLLRIITKICFLIFTEALQLRTTCTYRLCCSVSVYRLWPSWVVPWLHFLTLCEWEVPRD